MNLISLRSAPPEPDDDAADPAAIVAGLYAEHALGLTRLARVMLGDPDAAQDVVHDAFCGLVRRWRALNDPARAAAYLRSSVLNGCRDALRRQARRPADLPLRPELLGPDPLGPLSGGALSAGADAPLLALEDRRAVLAALRLPPDRQREALVLRYYLELPDAGVAQVMGIRESSVRSAAHRGLADLARLLSGEMS
jgi:RNA polymerase sigma factor (sigma-70 family)